MALYEQLEIQRIQDRQESRDRDMKTRSLAITAMIVSVLVTIIGQLVGYLLNHK